MSNPSIPSNPFEQQPFSNPGLRYDPQPPPWQPGQPQYQPLQYQPSPLQYLPSAQPSQPASKQTNGLAVTALVISSLTLLLVLAMIAFVVVTEAFSPTEGLAGTAPQVVAGEKYKGTLLADELSRVIRADFGEVRSMTCPESVVGAHVIVDCQGVIDGFDSTVKVTFEDAVGHFTLVED